MQKIPGFEQLAELASKNPEAFEKLRRDICKSYIDSTPPKIRVRLEAFQFRVEHEIRRAKTPLAGIIKLSAMMHDSLYLMNQKLLLLTAPPQEGDGAPPPQPESAEVVDFDRWRAKKRSPESDPELH
jgi:hypothetical protein